MSKATSKSISKPTSKAMTLNKRQGGSYSQDPNTGKVTLVSRTLSIEAAAKALANNSPATSTVNTTDTADTDITTAIKETTR